MMNMVEANVAGNPLQQLRQLIVRAPFYRCRNITPFLFMLEVGILELMLHIEQPDAQKA
ncbi:hypothetical protein D3C81_2062640 [compost metagenome]